MRRLLVAVLALALTVAIVAPAFGASAVEPIAITAGHAARPAASCSPGYTSANLSWGHKCLHAGEFCKRDKNAEYHRYGYHCPASGHLRRW